MGSSPALSQIPCVLVNHVLSPDFSAHLSQEEMSPCGGGLAVLRSSHAPGIEQGLPHAFSKSPSAQTHCCLLVQRISYKECDFPNNEPKVGGGILPAGGEDTEHLHFPLLGAIHAFVPVAAPRPGLELVFHSKQSKSTHLGLVGGPAIPQAEEGSQRKT